MLYPISPDTAPFFRQLFPRSFPLIGRSSTLPLFTFILACVSSIRTILYLTKAKPRGNTYLFFKTSLPSVHIRPCASSLSRLCSPWFRPVCRPSLRKSSEKRENMRSCYNNGTAWIEREKRLRLLKIVIFRGRKSKKFRFFSLPSHHDSSTYLRNSY